MSDRGRFVRDLKKLKNLLHIQVQNLTDFRNVCFSCPRTFKRDLVYTEKITFLPYF